MNENRPLADLDARVSSVWQRSQTLHLGAGLLAFCRWGILLFAIGVLLDWLLDFPSSFRIALLVFIVSFALYRAWRSGWQNLHRFSATRAALQMEDHEGDLESLLVTAIQFRESGTPSGTSKSLREATCQRAEEAVASVQAKKVVRYNALRRPLTIALVLSLLLAAFGVFNGPFLSAGIARIFPPWGDLAYPTRTQLELASHKMIVKEGDPAVINARVSGVVPNHAKLALRTGMGEPRIHDLKITDGHCEHTINSVYRGFEYRITAGDAKTPWQEVEVISSPRIKQAKLNLKYPAYTKRPVESVEALTVTVPEGTRIEWELALDRAVSKASCTSASGEVKTLEVSEDGLTATMNATAGESLAYSYSWVEKEHGFSFSSSSHYLQVAPDQPPRVELTSPKTNLYATLNRDLEFVFRGRDDHGIGEAHIAFRVNKIEEQKVALPAQDIGKGGEQKIDWDYRTALPDLVVGDRVSFAIELADRYPGANGPHRARSQARRITFLSKKDYLAQINKQKQRLLLKLRSLYREQRKVHATVRMLDPSAGEFIQSCQLEAVRQDLMRERIGDLKRDIQSILDDLTANKISDESVSALLVSLLSDLQVIADEHIGPAASQLRVLSANAHKRAASAAVNSIDCAARELGCLVLQIGFREATEVMARELHAIAENQAPIRMQTILPNEAHDFEALARSQEQLGQWATRLFGSLPKDKESSVEDALIAFNLSRLIKELRRSGVEDKMLEAASLIRKSKGDGAGAAPNLQAGIIKALLHAEFRLRIGSEFEALDKVGNLFALHREDQRKLRDFLRTSAPDQFDKDRPEFARAQIDLRKQLCLLLVPHIPAPRAALFDQQLPSPPPIGGLLAKTEAAMTRAGVHIDAGERDQAIAAQQRSGELLTALEKIIRERIGILSEREQLFSLGMGLGKHASEVTKFEERQLLLIEKTEDVEDLGEAVPLGQLQDRLAKDIGKFHQRIEQWSTDQLQASDDVPPLLSYLEQIEKEMNKTVVSLNGENIDDAIEHQETVLVLMEEVTALLAGQMSKNTFMAAILNDTWTAMLPAPFVADIQAEQLDLVATTAKAKPGELPALAIVQKNLVHAVNAVLGALDPLSHHIESGTVFLFAKDDMNAAATAIVDNDLVEAADAGSFVAESLGNLFRELAIVTPRYRYLLEINEFYHQAIAGNGLIQMRQNQLRNKARAAGDPAALVALLDEQRALQVRAISYSSKMFRGTGLKSDASIAESMSTVLEALKSGNQDAAVRQMQLIENTLAAENSQMIKLMELVSNVLQPSSTPEVSPESAMVLSVLSVASDQKVLYRKTQTKPNEGHIAEQLKLAQRCDSLRLSAEAFAQEYLAQMQSKLPTEVTAAQLTSLEQFIALNQTHLVLAQEQVAAAAVKLQTGAIKEAIQSQHRAGELLRYFLIAYINQFLVPPGPPSASDPVITEASESSLVDGMMMFMPGAVSGDTPKGGRQEWEVLGKRNRAALNENFARELPLEYRTVLKDYYERLAK